MQKERKYIYKPLQQVVSVLLLLLFLSIPVVQAFHHHPEKVTQQETPEDQDAVGVAVSKCLLCAYDAHSHGKVLHLSYPPVLVVPLPKAIVLGSRMYARIYKFTLQGFSNKGPPSCIPLPL